MPSNHALVFGASGISGWNTIVQALSYPTPTTFTSITGVTNRPLSKAEALLPEDERVILVSGIDLSLTPETAIEALKAKVPTIADITHVFFYAYIHEPQGGICSCRQHKNCGKCLGCFEASESKAEAFRATNWRQGSSPVAVRFEHN